MQKASRAERGLYGSVLYDFQPAILLANKRINSEARRLLYDENMFVLVRYPPVFPWDALRIGDLTLLAVKEDEVCCSMSSSRISLHVDLQYDLKYYGHEELPMKPRFVIAANELRIFCKILEGLDQECPGFLIGLNIKLGVFPRYQLVAGGSAITGSSSPLVWNPRPFPEQRMLLEPFSTLHSVKNLEIVSVDGKTERIDAQLMKEVKERASGLPPSMEEVKATTTKIEDHGNEAFRAGDFLHASILYKSAWENLKARNYYYYREMLSKPAEFIEGTRARLRLGLRIRSSLVAALLRLQLWSEAHKTATEQIKEIARTKDIGWEIYYDPGELAKLYYQRALASEGMEKLTQAAEEIREALRFDPNNMEMKAPLEEWVNSAK